MTEKLTPAINLFSFEDSSLSYRGSKKGSYGNHCSGRSVAGVQNNRSFRAKLVDAGLKAPLAKSAEQWMDAPNRFDLPEVDDPKESLPAKQVQELKADIKAEKVAKQEDSHEEIVESKPEASIKVMPSVEGSSATYNKATGWMAISFSSIPAPELRAEMKSNGFRYNPVRKQWVAKWYPYREELAKKYAGSIEQVDITPNWATKAEAAASQAVKHEELANEARTKADKLWDTIPFGQPVLVGHHSEKHHRKDLETIDRNLNKAVDERKIAQEYQSRAERYGKLATGEAPYKILRRIKRLEADKRKMKRQLLGDVVFIGEKMFRRKGSEPSDETKAEIKKWIGNIESRLEVENKKYKAAGGIVVS
jgi:hypothetical protein